MKQIKIQSLCLAIAATLACGAACSKKGSGKTVLTVWCSQADQALAKEIAERFKKENEEKHYEFRFAVQGENDAATKILNDVEAAADVFSISNDQLPKLVAGDALTKIGGERLENLKERNEKAAIDAATSEVNGVTGVYGFPYTDNTFFLYYDRSVLTETDVKTLDGILAKCSASNRFAMPINDGWYSTSFYFGADLGYEVTYASDLEETKITCDFGNDTGKAVTEAVWELVKDSRTFADADDSKIAAGFADKSIVAAVSGIWNKTVFEKYLGENFAAARLPSYTLYRGTAQEEQVPLTAFAGYKLMSVGQYSKHKADATAFADYYTNEQNQVERFEKRGFLPTNKAARENTAVKEDICARAIAAQLENSKTQKNVPSTLWIPMQGLGNAMVTAAATGSSFRLETELAACIAAIEK